MKLSILTLVSLACTTLATVSTVEAQRTMSTNWTRPHTSLNLVSTNFVYAMHFSLPEERTLNSVRFRTGWSCFTPISTNISVAILSTPNGNSTPNFGNVVGAGTDVMAVFGSHHMVLSALSGASGNPLTLPAGDYYVLLTWTPQGNCAINPPIAASGPIKHSWYLDLARGWNYYPIPTQFQIDFHTASWETSAVGCGSISTQPAIDATLPRLGDNLEVSLTGVDPFASAWLLVGTQQVTIHLNIIDMPGCYLLVGAPIVSILTAANHLGVANINFGTVTTPGILFTHQWFVLDPAFTNPFGLLTSQRGESITG